MTVPYYVIIIIIINKDLSSLTVRSTVWAMRNFMMKFPLSINNWFEFR